MAIVVNDLRRGMIILYNGDLCQVVDIEFIRPGNWRALAQAKLRNLKTGSTFIQRYQTTEKVDEATVETKLMQFLYSDDNFLHFMDMETYEQMEMELEEPASETFDSELLEAFAGIKAIAEETENEELENLLQIVMNKTGYKF